jgi:hypothetical protein
MMGDIPVNRHYAYEYPFFKDGAPVVEGTTFPLKKKSFKSGRIKLGKTAKRLGAPARVDVRNISYAAGDE